VTVAVEPLAAGEVRVTVLGTGDPFVRPSQASACVLVEVGNDDRGLFLHADQMGDMPTLLYSPAKAGRRDPVEVWGPAGATEALGTRTYADRLQAAHAWDYESLRGHPGQSGARAATTEVPYDATAMVHERGG
jgi:ribonuclease Z